MQNIIGVPYREIPHSTFIDLETGEETPNPGPQFSSRVAPTQAEMEAQHAEERYEQARLPQPLIIDIAALSAIRRSTDPEVWERQKELMAEVQMMKLEIDNFAQTVLSVEIRDLKATHKSLCDVARSSKEKVEKLTQPLADARNGLQHAQRDWNRQQVQVETVRSQMPKLENYPSDADYGKHNDRVAKEEAKLAELAERAEGWSEEIVKLEGQLFSARRTFERADAQVKAVQKRIDRLEGKAPEKRSSYRPGNAVGLI